MISDAGRLDLLDALYKAAVAPHEWPEALELMRQAFNACGTHIVLYNPRTGELRKNSFTGYGNLDDLLAVGDRVSIEDPWAKHALENTDPTVAKKGAFILQGAEQIPFHDFQKTPFYNEVCSIVGVADHLSFVVPVGAGWFATLALNAEGENRIFTSEHRMLAQWMLPHLERAVAISHRLDTASPSEKSLEALWRDSTLPLFVLSDARVIYANMPAMTLLEQGEIVKSINSRIAFTATELDEAYRSLTVSPERRSRQISVLATADDGGQWLVQMIRATEEVVDLTSRFYFDPPSLRVVIVMTPLSEQSIGRIDALQGFSYFTPTERRLLELLLNGDTVETVAAQIGRSTETVRWHLKNMLRKTGAKSTADLIRIAALLMPW